jgi:hypothetical protein
MSKARVIRCTRPAGGCGEPIVFLRTRNKALMPVDVENEDDLPDEGDIYDPVEHMSHYRTCRVYMEVQAAKGGKGKEQEEGF